jgi:signal transduction histidine kinase
MIVRVHGGDLVVTDSPLGGACLSMSLPVDPTPPDSTQS